MSRKRKSMRLLILGDKNVGKTSLIQAIMCESVPNQSIKTLKKVILPPQLCIYSKDIFTQIIDFNKQNQQQQQYKQHNRSQKQHSSHISLHQQIKQSDIILLIYDISNHETIIKLQGYWLPIIHKIRDNIPIILVGNKIDKKQLQSGDKQLQYTNIKIILKSVIKKYKQVQMGIQCSAYYDRNVKKVLNCAQRAVLYPLSPLYDSQSKQLTVEFKKAIKRIFRVLDKNLTGSITDAQLKNLQQRVFQTQLNNQDIKVIKQIILRELQQYDQDCIKLKGFQTLQKKCIQMLKIQVCWSILRYFDYNDNLEIQNIQEEYIYDEKQGEGLELTQGVMEFLEKLYVKCKVQLEGKKKAKGQNNEQGEGQNNVQGGQDQDQNQHEQYNQNQNYSIMDELFSCSLQIPLQQFKSASISLQKFISTWQMFCFLDYKQCYHNLLYIGYQGGMDITFKKTRSKNTYSDLLKLKQKKIYSILFIQNDNYLLDGQMNALFKNGARGKFNQIRETWVYTQEKKQSRLLLMVKINQRDLESFLKEKGVRRRVDLVVGFEEENERDNKMMKDSNNIKQISNSKLSRYSINFPSHTMLRILSTSLMSHLLQSTKSSLDLQSFPVQFKQQSFQALLSQVIRPFQDIQLGYSKQKIQKLRRQSEKLNKLLIGVGLMIAVGVGCVMFNKNPLEWVKGNK